MTAYTNPTLIYLGNFATTDSYEGDYTSEYANNLVGVSRDYTEMQLVTVESVDRDHDGVMEDDECNPNQDHITYDLGSGAQSQYTDGSLQLNLSVTLSDGSVITVEAVAMQMQNGDLFVSDLFNNGTLDNLEISEIQIDSVTGSTYEGWYTNQSVDNTTLVGPVATGDGIVEGSAGDDLIDLGYTGDPDGDMVDAGDAILPGEAPDDDIIVAGAGNDTVLAGEGDDDVYAGSGNDTVEGGAGDDLIYGDSTLAGYAGDTVRESFEWDQAPGFGDNAPASVFTQNTGSVDVTFSIVSEDSGVDTEFETDSQYIAGIDGDGAPVEDNSSLYSVANGENNDATYALDFSDEVENVSFRVNDIDGDGKVTILAFDADGNPINVDLDAGDYLSTYDSDGQFGADTAKSTGGYEEDTSPNYSVLVTIPGPVSRIEITHRQFDEDNSGINVTDVYFDATAGDTGPAGDDTLSGGEGDDVILGEGGDDLITGGTGADDLSGGDDRDTFIGGNAGDFVDGGEGGVDYDTLDLSGVGPLQVVYDPSNPENGTVTFLDGNGDPDGTMDFINIENVILPENNGPDAMDDTATTDEDTSVIIDVLANDTDPDFDDLTVTDATSPNGDVTINPDGTLTFVPDQDFNGLTTITYTIDDGNGGTDVAEVTVTVTPVNDAPDAMDDTATVPEDGTVDIPVLENDSDVDGDPLTVTDATSPNGTVTINPDGTLTYEPDPDFNGTDTITYTIDDGNGGTDVAEVTVTVTPVNDAPVAMDDSDSMDENTTVTIDLLANDSDVDGDPLTVIDISAPANGTVTDNGDGTVDYTPDADFTGTDTFTYTISDGNGGTDTASVTVDVANVNDGPDAVDDTANTGINTPVVIAVLANDTDPDGDPLEVIDATSPDGTVTINPDGTITFDPATDVTGTATITYTVADPSGATDIAEVQVLINDGIVEGTAGDDLIDLGYMGDPEGDRVDNLDEILPGEGPNDDIIEAYEGDDTVYGGLGNDEIDGGAGDDTIFGEAGDDVIVDAQGSDTVDGGAGNDTIDVAGGDSPDTIAELLALGDPNGLADLDYSPYSEVIPVDATPNDDLDTVFGGDGNDTIITGDDKDFVDGGAGDDTIYSGIDDDTVYGGTGNDYIEDVQGADVIYGGDGNDTIIAGFDTISDYIGDDPNVPNPIYPFPNDQNQIDGIDYVDGGAGDDIIQTGDDRDTILGGTGNDTIDAGIDDDTVDGGEGHDYIEGGHGSDVIDGGLGDDVIWGGEGPGSDPLNIIDAIDPVPTNGIDVIHGGAGNDIIYGQDDDDILHGDAGDDTIDGGIDEDTIYGGEGLDTISGGQGADLIYGGDGADVIDGGTEDDVIYAGEGKDVVHGGEGDDFIDGETGEDILYGDAGDDTILGTSGADELYGGDGNDDLSAGLNDDYVEGGAGDDVIDAGAGEDEVHGGAGDDVIQGGSAADVIYGDAGDDFIDGGEGRDSVFGGDDQDYFVNVGVGDTVDGNEGGVDWDTLDLTGTAPNDGSLHVTYTTPNEENGFVTFFDQNGAATGTMDFYNIEKVIPCFTPGTMIATPKGERRVEELKVGDKVITRDNGIQEIRWLGAKPIRWQELATAEHLKPVLIRAGALGNGLPERDMMVSPNHRILVANDRTTLYFDEREVLASAKHLVDNKGVMTVEPMGVTYIHFMFDHHEVVLSDGAWTESFQPGDHSLKGIGNAQRQELFELFPELETQAGIEDYTAARRILKKHEAQMLTKK